MPSVLDTRVRGSNVATRAAAWTNAPQACSDAQQWVRTALDAATWVLNASSMPNTNASHPTPRGTPPRLLAAGAVLVPESGALTGACRGSQSRTQSKIQTTSRGSSMNTSVDRGACERSGLRSPEGGQSLNDTLLLALGSSSNMCGLLHVGTEYGLASGHKSMLQALTKEGRGPTPSVPRLTRGKFSPAVPFQSLHFATTLHQRPSSSHVHGTKPT
jgi:hypothetical protein